MEKSFNLKCKKLHPDAKLPSRSYGSAGFDLYSVVDCTLPPAVDSRTYEIMTTNVTMIPTGIAMEIPEDYVFLIWDRSGMGAKGIHRLAGVCDANFRGEIKVCLINLSNYVYQIKKGDRIAQGLIQKIECPEAVWVEELDDSERGNRGFASSGR